MVRSDLRPLSALYRRSVLTALFCTAPPGDPAGRRCLFRGRGPPCFPAVSCSGMKGSRIFPSSANRRIFERIPAVLGSSSRKGRKIFPRLCVWTGIPFSMTPFLKRIPQPRKHPAQLRHGNAETGKDRLLCARTGRKTGKLVRVRRFRLLTIPRRKDPTVVSPSGIVSFLRGSPLFPRRSP